MPAKLWPTEDHSQEGQACEAWRSIGLLALDPAPFPSNPIASKQIKAGKCVTVNHLSSVFFALSYLDYSSLKGKSSQQRQKLKLNKNYSHAFSI